MIIAITVTIASIIKRIVSIPTAPCIAAAVLVCVVPHVPFSVGVDVVTLDKMVGSRYNSIEVTMKARTPPRAMLIMVLAAPSPFTDFLSLSNRFCMLSNMYYSIYILGYACFC